eukprot:Hpha_TRINITY_DN16169_c1_g1::TRINITY_DN16169_c1_g1_i22::g.4852::m.4852
MGEGTMRVAGAIASGGAALSAVALGLRWFGARRPREPPKEPSEGPRSASPGPGAKEDRGDVGASPRFQDPMQGAEVRAEVLQRLVRQELLHRSPDFARLVKFLDSLADPPESAVERRQLREQLQEAVEQVAKFCENLEGRKAVVVASELAQARAQLKTLRRREEAEAAAAAAAEAPLANDELELWSGVVRGALERR